MSFYRADRENDKNREVIRKNHFAMDEFWGGARPGANFMITGGEEEERIWALCGAVRDYLVRKGKSVILIHNNANLDGLLYRELYEKEKLAGFFRIFGDDPGHAAYQPFKGMTARQVLTCLEGQCRLRKEVRTPELIAYASSLLAILEQYEEMSLYQLRRLCMESEQDIIGLAERVGMSENVKNAIRLNVQAGSVFRSNIIGRLAASGEAMLNQKNEGGSSLLTLLREDEPGIISIHLAAHDSDSIFRYLMDELVMANRELLLVFMDVNLTEANGGLQILTNRRAAFSVGLCSGEVRSMFSNANDNDVRNVRANIAKLAIFHYHDAAAADRIASFFGQYERKTKVQVVAPAKPWVLIRGKAPGETKSIENRVFGTELKEMDYGAGVLAGHRGNQIYFVRKIQY